MDDVCCRTAARRNGAIRPPSPSDWGESTAPGERCTSDFVPSPLKGEAKGTHDAAMAIPTNLRIDGNRLLWRLETLAKIGDTGDGGCRRLALSDEDRQGRDLLVSWMRELGLEVRVDRVGNILGLMAGESDGPAVMLGSHIDTVATGGRHRGAPRGPGGPQTRAGLEEARGTPKRPGGGVAL